MQVLLADPDPEQREATRSALVGSGFDVVAVDSVSAVVDELDGTGTQAVVTEDDLDDGTGLALIEVVRERSPDAVCVLYTRTDIDAIDTGDSEVIVEYLSKDAPDAESELASLLRHSVALGTQTAYPLPDDEAARLTALDAYDDVAPELGASLDRLTEIATELFGVDSAAVGLIDRHHERFLSCHGAEFGTIEREGTVCTYTILDAGVTVVEDVQADPRFEDDEGLADAGVAFYAGAPLVTDEGHAVGVFCLHAGAARSFSERERTLLALLADQAMETLDLYRQVGTAGGRPEGETDD